MSTALGLLGARGDLTTRRIPAPRPPGTGRSILTPFGRILLTRDKGQGITTGREQFVSTLSAKHYGRDGKLIDVYELGSGIVLNCGVNAMANDFSWTNATLKSANFHSLGTSGTAAAQSDVVQGTLVPAGNLSGSTNGYMTGVQSLVTPNKYQTVATFTAAAAITVTEWGLHTGSFAPISIPTAGTTYTATGAAFTALGSAPAVGSTIINLAAAANTPTTTAMGTITASSTTTVTIPGWFTLANAGASTPTNATAAQIVASMLDHKTFGAITLANGDTLQITYQFQLVAGG